MITQHRQTYASRVGFDYSVLRCDVQLWVQITSYRWSVMIISNGWRMPSSAEPRGRTESTSRDEQPMGGSSNW